MRFRIPTDVSFAVFIALLICAIMTALPLISIWSLNVLGCAIPFTLKTWFAMLCLILVFAGSSGSGSRRS